MDGSEVRVTLAVAQLLRVFLDRIREPQYGYELMKVTGFPSGKLYPILARLQAAGWLERQSEAVDPAVAGRPARYHYRLSEKGAAAARHALAAVYQDLAPTSTQRRTLRTAGGAA
jgi:DNA-binding PadR family transcriptional regulator